MVGRRTEIIGPCSCCGGPSEPTFTLPCAQKLVYDTTLEEYASRDTPHDPNEVPVWASATFPETYTLTLPTMTTTPTCTGSCVGDSAIDLFDALQTEIGGSITLTPGGTGGANYSESGLSGDAGYPTIPNFCADFTQPYNGIDILVSLGLCSFGGFGWSGETNQVEIISEPFAVLLNIDISLNHVNGEHNIYGRYAAHFPGDGAIAPASVTFELVGHARSNTFNQAGTAAGCGWGSDPADVFPATLTMTG